MKGLHVRQLVLAVAVAATALVVTAGSAAAKPIDRGTFHDDFTQLVEDFCGVPGLTIENHVIQDGTFTVNSHGKDQLAYYQAHHDGTQVITSLANGVSLTSTSSFLSKDHKVTDNGDGTLTILVIATGNATLYGLDGKAIARDPGQLRSEVLIDHGGTPTDPSDDEFLEFLGVVKDSTGRSDDFCEAAVPLLL